MSEPRDPYDVLGIPRTASKRQIRAAYVAHARQAHPDVVGGHGLERMRALNEAWAVLKDEGRKAAWDQASAPGGAAVGGPAIDAAQPDGERPFWTGAMGAPPGRPSGPVLRFGIFEGWSLGEIARRDPGYLLWLRNRVEARAFRDDIVRLLDPAAEEATKARSARRR